MQRISLSIFILMVLGFSLAAHGAQAQQETPTAPPSDTPVGSPTLPRSLVKPEISILSPLPGEALQGSVTITGSSAAESFVSAEVSFTYAGDRTGTWFLVGESSDPVTDGMLAQWNTSAITDGEYDLRLRVLLEDGSHLEAVISGLRVRNYTPIETGTPTPVTPTIALQPGELPLTSTVTPTSLPTATPLPTNPAEVTSQDIAWGFGKGALAVIGLFALMGVYKLVTGIGSIER